VQGPSVISLSFSLVFSDEGLSEVLLIGVLIPLVWVLLTSFRRTLSSRLWLFGFFSFRTLFAFFTFTF